MKKVEDKRLSFFDNYKAILIILVVFAHFLHPYALELKGVVRTVYTYIYMFHMPAFVFISGFFSKSENSKSEKSIFKLLIIYLIFNSLMGLFLYKFEGNRLDFLSPYNCYWYLLSLICWRLTVKKVENIKYIIPISFIICLLVGFIPVLNTNMFSIRRTICFYPFFLLGYKLSKDSLKILLSKRNKVLFEFSIILFIILSIISIVLIKNIGFSSKVLLYSKYTCINDFIRRVILISIACSMILLSLFVVPKKNIGLFTKIGENSLLIYVTHRFITLLFLYAFPVSSYTNYVMYSALFLTIIFIYIFSKEKINLYFNKFIEFITNIIVNKKIIKYALLLICYLLILYSPVKKIYSKLHTVVVKNKVVKIEDNTIRLSYVGDLILLKQQVESAYNSNKKEYDFNNMFKYTKDHLTKSDFSIGIYEGPSAGNSKPYSTSNYGDGIPLYLNFPDSFAKAVKDSGIDLVNTANNHMLDCGRDGANRTLEVLDNVGLDHIGTYNSKKDRDNIYIKEIDGIKIAFLSYAKSLNYNKMDDVYSNDKNFIGIMPLDDSIYYKELKNKIKNDFNRAKSLEPDLIVVMAHMGTQFIHKTDSFQKKWNKIFAEYGADIVLGDHSHAVQPIEKIGKTLIVNCPGNYANSYIKEDGDATAIVDIYIDKTTKNVKFTDVVPMYTYEEHKGYFIAVPIYDLINKTDIKLSEKKLNRVNEVLGVITKTMVGEKYNLENMKDNYYNILETTCPFVPKPIELENTCPDSRNVDIYSNKELVKLIEKSKNVAFIGDSITEGTRNDFHGWYEYLMKNRFNDKNIINISEGAYTTRMIRDKYRNNIEEADADLYVIALGTNDVRYRNQLKNKDCAMTKEEYVDAMNDIIKLTNSKNIVLIAPWLSISDGSDIFQHVGTDEEKDKMLDDYADALEEYANKHNYLYINPNIYLRNFFNTHYYGNYLVDFIHPNKDSGIKLYSNAVLYSSK